MTSKSDPNGNAPFLLSPVGKDYLWGGNRLNTEFAKGIDMYPLAETWECSTHPNGLSVVASGKYKGLSLSDVLKVHPEYIGTHPQAEPGQIPVLVKFIDARDDLSIQVHPTDEYAAKNEHGQRGKTEMWYVIDADKDTSLVYGFRHSITEKALRDALTSNKLSRYLNKVPVKKNDIFLIEAGTVHAIGKGALIAEIQESSDLTYRLYDYGRVDKHGKQRELHIDKALQVAKLTATETPKQPLRVLRYRNGRATELLARCKYFQAERMVVNTERVREMAEYRTGSSTFQILLVYSGCGVLLNEADGTALSLFQGDCVFVPANSASLKIHGKMELIRIRC